MPKTIEIRRFSESRQPSDPIEFRLVVSSTNAGREVRFKGAIGQGGNLDLVESTTPFEKRFTARSVIAMFESLDLSLPINVELFGDIGQSMSMDLPIRSFMGPNGGIAEDFIADRSLGVGGIYG